MKEKSIILFNQKTIRRHWDNEKELWYFSIVDIIQVLANTNRPRKYWNDLKRKLVEEGSEVYDKIVRLKMIVPDGKEYYSKEIKVKILLYSI